MIRNRVSARRVISSSRSQNRVTLASSNGASTSSSTQIGAGLARNTAKISASAVSVCSPPDSRTACDSFLPGGWHMISSPASSGSSLSTITRLASPPPNRCLNSIEKACRSPAQTPSAAARAPRGSASAMPVAQRADGLFEVLPFSFSSVSCSVCTSRASSSARRFTAPSASRWRRSRPRRPRWPRPAAWRGDPYPAVPATGPEPWSSTSECASAGQLSRSRRLQPRLGGGAGLAQLRGRALGVPLGLDRGLAQRAFALSTAHPRRIAPCAPRRFLAGPNVWRFGWPACPVRPGRRPADASEALCRSTARQSASRRWPAAGLPAVQLFGRLSCRRLVRASPSRRSSSWAERLVIIVSRAASTVMRMSSTRPRAASRSGNFAHTCASAAVPARPAPRLRGAGTASSASSSLPCRNQPGRFRRATGRGQPRPRPLSATRRALAGHLVRLGQLAPACGQNAVGLFGARARAFGIFQIAVSALPAG